MDRQNLTIPFSYKNNNKQSTSALLEKELNGISIANNQVARYVAKLLGVGFHGTGYILGKIFAAEKIQKRRVEINSHT